MPLGFPVAGCCGSCDGNGAPNSLTVTLSGYTGDLASVNGVWTLYASAWGPPCTYKLKYGPPRRDPTVLDENGFAIFDFRASVLATIDGATISVSVIDGTPCGVAGSGSTISVFNGSLGSAPVNCAAIDVALSLFAHNGDSGGAAASCSVSAGGPGRHCVDFPGCVNTGTGSGAGTGSGSGNVYVRQPGKTTQCRQACECGCVCDTRARPQTIKISFSGFGSGNPNPNDCITLNGDVKYTLPFTGFDGEGNCVYGGIDTNWNYYLIATLGFPGDPSEQGVFARLEMHRDRDPGGVLEYMFELDHLEWQTSNYTWGGPGTFPCPGQSWELPMVLDNGNQTANNTLGGPCITEDLTEVLCLFETSADYTGLPSVSCCCGGAPDGKGNVPDLYICIQSVDPLCQKLNGVLAQLLYQGSSGQLSVATWAGNVTLDDSTSVSLTLTFSGGQWHGGISCGGGASVPIAFPSLNSSTDVSNGGCCTGTLTLTLTDHPVACGGNVTSGAVGCCGCAAGVDPPNNLLVTIPAVNLSADRGACQGCDATACVQAGAYVVDYQGLAPVPGCQGGCNPCGRCHYQAVFPSAQCDYLGNVYQLKLAVDVWIDWQGNLTVQTSVGETPDCGGATVIWSGNTTPAGCPTIDVDVPFSGAAGNGVCSTNAAAHVASL